MNLPASTSYGWLMLLGIGISLFFWTRLARRDHRLLLIYLAALLGAFLGAKLVYLAAEGWLHWHDPSRWVVLATGKSITGALLGGWMNSWKNSQAVEVEACVRRYCRRCCVDR